jgi:hypothetical protein
MSNDSDFSWPNVPGLAEYARMMANPWSDHLTSYKGDEKSTITKKEFIEGLYEHYYAPLIGGYREIITNDEVAMQRFAEEERRQKAAEEVERQKAAERLRVRREKRRAHKRLVDTLLLIKMQKHETMRQIVTKGNWGTW